MSATAPTADPVVPTMLAVTDAYVYLFTMTDGPAGGSRISPRPATLEAIRGKGRPIMESQLVVDQTELDGDGFLLSTLGNSSLAVDELSAEIRSIELRAASRDRKALTLNDSTDGQDKYMLSLESRELRKQGRRLTRQRTEVMSDAIHHSAPLGAQLAAD
jgi:hypothetical protein